MFFSAGMTITGDSLSDAVEDRDDNPDEGQSDEEQPSDAEVSDNSEEPDANADVDGQNQESDLPDKYQGKSKKEVADMHNNLESKLHEQGEEIAELRGELKHVETGDGSEQQNDDKSSVDEAIEEVADNDDMPDPFSEPEKFQEAVIRRTQQVVQETVGDAVDERLEPVEREVSQKKSEELLDKYEAENPEFGDLEDEMMDIVSNTTVSGDPIFSEALQNASSEEETFEILDTVMAKAKQRSGYEASSSTQSNGTKSESKATSTNGQSSTDRSGSTEKKEEEKESLEQTIEDSIGPNIDIG